MQEILLNSGIEKGVIVLLLMVPVVATLVSLSRHVIGMRSLGIYLTIIITFIFYKLGMQDNSFFSDQVQGLKYGLLLIFIAFTSSALAYQVFKNMTLHYYPKLALVITTTSIAIIGVVILAGILKLNGLLKLDVFSLILVVGISEKYMSIFARKSFKATIFISLESIILGVLCYLLISWQGGIEFILKYPYVLLLLFPVNYIIGKLSMLRISEYFRFWSILTDEEPK